MIVFKEITMILRSCDTRVVMFTVIFCRNLNMLSVQVDKETLVWIQKSYLRWVSKNDHVTGYAELEQSMSEHIKTCFM